MYELINTSIPNGLLPGTHGYSTVAMTKGFPDALRVRLEALCAYQHRSNAHDETYKRENPVNWFHVILPQRVHAVGCVAPSDFDYTGRTNRLARIYAFAEDEMPPVGGVAILQNRRARFREQWSGEVRWLDASSMSANDLKCIRTADEATAPAWCSMFGETDGLRLAKQFARLLESNITAGGKSIYFKTSTSKDIEGSELLALFSDLVDLLPAGMRKSVTFATYPAAFPNGTICHLRGVYDTDRTFETLAATQPWVDCTTGEIHHKEKLPHAEVQVAVSGDAPKAAVARAKNAFSATPKRHSTVAVAVRMDVGHPHSSYLPTPKIGTKRFLGILITAVTALVISASIAVLLWVRGDKPKHIEEDDFVVPLDAGTNTQDVVDNVEQAVPTSKEHVVVSPVSKDDMEAKRTDERNKERARKQATSKKEKEDARARAEKEKKEAEERERKVREDAIAFVTAKKVIAGRPKKPELPGAGKDTSKQQLEYRIFYYLNGDTVLTNVITRYEAVVFQGKTRDYKLSFVPPKESCCVVWFAGDTAWIDFRKVKPSCWFKSSDTCDLRKMCFGESQEVYDTWKRQHQSAWSYNIKAGENELASLDRDTFTFSDAMDMVYKKDFKEKKDQIRNLEEEIGQKNGELGKLESNINRYVQITNRVAALEKELASLNKDRKKNRERIKTCKNDKEELEEEKITIGIPDSGVLDRRKEELKKGKEAVQKDEEKLKAREDELNKMKNAPERVKHIREMELTVEVVYDEHKGGR